MTKDDEIRLFAQLAGNNHFKAWLEQEKATAIKYLVGSPDNNTLRRAQGTYSFIEKMSELMAHANKSLR
jgi:hypothetical protein